MATVTCDRDEKGHYIKGNIASDNAREKSRLANIGNKNCLGKKRLDRTLMNKTKEHSMAVSKGRIGMKFTEEHKKNI